MWEGTRSTMRRPKPARPVPDNDHRPRAGESLEKLVGPGLVRFDQSRDLLAQLAGGLLAVPLTLRHARVAARARTIHGTRARIRRTHAPNVSHASWRGGQRWAAVGSGGQRLFPPGCGSALDPNKLDFPVREQVTLQLVHLHAVAVRIGARLPAIWPTTERAGDPSERRIGFCCPSHQFDPWPTRDGEVFAEQLAATRGRQRDRLLHKSVWRLSLDVLEARQAAALAVHVRERRRA